MIRHISDEHQQSANKLVSDFITGIQIGNLLIGSQIHN